MKPKNHCWKCADPIDPSDFSRGSSCNRCGLDTRVCRNCKFWDETAHNQCREPQADRVLEKERSNFCDYFDPSDRRPPGESSEEDPREKARRAAEALFKKM